MTKNTLIRYGTLLASCLVIANVLAFGDDPPTEDDFYVIQEVPIPPDVYLEVGALEILDDKLYASSRRGDIYSISGAFGNDCQMRSS